MGFFSWRTSDTNQVIYNVHSGKHRPVYFLMPGNNHILEKEYDGYGVFGGADAYIWLASVNLDIKKMGLKKEQIRFAGIALDVGFYYIDKDTGKKYAYDLDFLGFNSFGGGNFGTIIPEIGMSANQAINSGRFLAMNISDLFPIKFPIKFSFNEKVDYNLLPPAKIAENQGFF